MTIFTRASNVDIFLYAHPMSSIRQLNRRLCEPSYTMCHYDCLIPLRYRRSLWCTSQSISPRHIHMTWSARKLARFRDSLCSLQCRCLPSGLLDHTSTWAAIHYSSCKLPSISSTSTFPRPRRASSPLKDWLRSRWALQKRTLQLSTCSFFLKLLILFMIRALISHRFI